MLELGARMLIVALIAAISSGVPTAFVLTQDVEANLRLAQGLRLTTLALVGCIVVGLPVATFTFFKIRDNRSIKYGSLLIIANLIAVALVALLAILAGAFGATFFGIPTNLAANAFAIAGWFIVLKPARANSQEM